jgi:hypothetical protein
MWAMLILQSGYGRPWQIRVRIRFLVEQVKNSVVRRIVLIGAAAAPYVVNFWPAPLLRDAVLNAFGNPPYKGVWLLIPHLFLYTTLQALVCLLLWTVLVRAGWMPKLQLSLRWRTFAWGLGAGLFSVAVMVAFFFATGQAGAFHAPHTQYPLVLQGMIAVLAAVWAWAGKRGGGLLAPYTAHMALDWIIDPIL